MSINLGNDGVNAARELRSSPSWAKICEALRLQTVAKMNAAMEAPIGDRVDATAYARALRDLWIAFESATTATNQNAVAKPGPEKKNHAA